MHKVFEDYFSELQADMVSICLEYADERVDRIYVYCSCEGKIRSCDFFYCINGIIVRKHQLNDAINSGVDGFRYDTSVERQIDVMDIINEDIGELCNLCSKYKREMPTEIRLVYDAKKNSLSADYKYDLMYTNDPIKTSDDVAMEWFEEVKSAHG